jgi:hypothetical protein
MANVASASGNSGGSPKIKKQPPRRAKLRGLATLEILDGRTVAARRAHDLARRIESDLGGIDQMTAGQHQLAQHASVLGALIESDEAQWLQGKPVDLTMWFAAVNSQRRILTTLGLDHRVARDITPPTFEDIRAEIDAEKAAAIEANSGDAE